MEKDNKYHRRDGGNQGSGAHTAPVYVKITYKIIRLKYEFQLDDFLKLADTLLGGFLRWISEMIELMKWLIHRCVIAHNVNP